MVWINLQSSPTPGGHSNPDQPDGSSKLMSHQKVPLSHLEDLGEVGWPIHLCGWLGLRHRTAFIVLTSQICITQNSMHFPKCLKFKCRILLLIFIWMPLQRGLVVALLDLCRSCLLLHSKQAVQICMVSKGLLNQSHGLVRSTQPGSNIYLGQCKWNNFYYPDIWHPYSKFMKLRTSIGPLWCHIVCCAALRLTNWSWLECVLAMKWTFQRIFHVLRPSFKLSHHGHSWFKLSNSWGQDWEFLAQGWTKFLWHAWMDNFRPCQGIDMSLSDIQIFECIVHVFCTFQDCFQQLSH